MIAPVIVVLDECFNRFSQFAWHLVRYQLDIPLDGAVVSFYLAVGLRVIRRGYDVPDPHQPQVFTKLPGTLATIMNSVTTSIDHSRADRLVFGLIFLVSSDWSSIVAPLGSLLPGISCINYFDYVKISTNLLSGSCSKPNSP